MKIKYKKKLIKRAEHNVKADVKFIGHDFLELNSDMDAGERPFLVCAVGCLVLPDKGKDRTDFLKVFNSVRGIGSWHKRLEEEFGIPEYVSEEAENYFTGLKNELNRNGASDKMKLRRLGDFVIAFTKALPEGYTWPDIDDDGWAYPEMGHDRKSFLEWLKRQDASRKGVKKLATA